MTEFDDTFTEVALSASLKKFIVQEDKVVLELKTSDPGKFADIARYCGEPVLIHVAVAQGEIKFNEGDDFPEPELPIGDGPGENCSF